MRSAGRRRALAAFCQLNSTCPDPPWATRLLGAGTPPPDTSTVPSWGYRFSAVTVTSMAPSVTGSIVAWYRPVPSAVPYTYTSLPFDRHTRAPATPVSTTKVCEPASMELA